MTYFKNLLVKFNLTKLMLFATLIAIAFFFIYPPGRTQIQVKLSTDADSVFQVYWADVDQNYTEKQSVSIRTREGGSHNYTLYLPDLKMIRKLRIDPAGKVSEIIINNLVIKQIGYESIRFFSKGEFSQLIPQYDIRNIDYQSDGLKIISYGEDPQLEVSVNPIAESHLWVLLHYAIGYAKLILMAFLLSASFIFALKIIVKIPKMFIRMNEACNMKTSVSIENSNRLFNNKRLILIVTSIFFIIIMYLLGQKIYVEFNGHNIFGTNRAPYSDALGWLHGALCNYFNKGSIYPLFRPTIGIFFSSIYSVSNQIYFIPLFSIIFFYINMILIFLFFDQRMKIYLTLLLLFLLLFFHKLVDELNLGQLMMDFLPFVFTILCIFFTGWALKNKNIQFHFLYTGLFILGIASAVRGMQLVGGFLIVMTAMIIIWKRANKINILFLPLIFLAPLIIDMYLQKISGAVNNGMMHFFCFYSDHHHFYTRVCGAIYRTMELSHAEVLVNYFKFIFTQEGFGILFEYIEDLMIANLTIFQSKYYLALLILSTIILTLKNFSDDCIVRLKYMFAHVLKKKSLPLPNPNPAFNFFIIKVLVHVIIIPMSVWAFPQYAVVIFLGYLVLLLIIALLSNLIFTSICLSLYLGGALLFTMMGAPGEERVSSSFAFTLFIGYIFFIIEDNRYTAFPLPKRTNLILGFNIFIIVFLYAGNFIIPLRSNYYIKDKPLIKISDEARLDRSLYYDKDTSDIFYTQMNHEEIGTVCSYTDIMCPKGGGSRSLRYPCVIIKGVQ
ncbi:hypothetical protein QUF75_00475 [Desulfococcaceae bacterium HSG7]|nr:hypothetical protein [Desulfococcaceae bacterium HSG7]